MTTNLPFLRWLVAHPAVRAGGRRPRSSTEHPPLSAPPLRLPRGPVGRRLAAQPALRRRRTRRPTSTQLPRDPAGDGAEQSALTAPMPGTVIRVLAKEGDRVAGPPAAARARGDEDGDAARLALRRASSRPSTSPRATGSPGAPCSSSSRSDRRPTTAG